MVTLGSDLGNGSTYVLDLNELTRHMFVVGASGSGKTGSIITLVEQVLHAGVPTLLIDVKGDLSNVLKQDGSLRDRIIPRLLTPGSSVGEPVNFFGKLLSEQGMDQAVSSLLELLGIPSNRAQESYHLFLTSILKEMPAANFTLEDLLPVILEPNIEYLGMLQLNDVLPFSDRRKLAIKLNNLIANPSFDNWRTGATLDFDELFQRDNNERTPVVSYNVSHLTDDHERMTAVTFVIKEYLAWTLRQAGSKELRSLLVTDEISPFLPPFPRNPPSKAPLLSLVKQARAFGNGVILATQSAKSIDYQATSQAKTHIIGRLQTKHDRDRVMEGMEGNINFDRKLFSQRISALQARQFLVLRENKVNLIRSRDTETNLTGPMDKEELVSLRENGYVFPLSRVLGLRDKLASTWALWKNTGEDRYLEEYVKLES